MLLSQNEARARAQRYTSSVPHTKHQLLALIFFHTFFWNFHFDETWRQRRTGRIQVKEGHRERARTGPARHTPQSPQLLSYVHRHITSHNMYASLRTTTVRSALRFSSVSAKRCTAPLVVRYNSTEAAPEAAAAAAVDPKIQSIVDSISTLTLVETSALIKTLKSQLDIPDIAFPVGGAAAPAAAPAESAAAAEDAAPAAAEKTIFNVKLESFDAKTKAKVIKEVKGLLGLSLVDSKKFVEAAPKVLKENVAKEDAEKIKATLEGLGAKVTLE